LAKYPWGTIKNKERLKVWLGENGLLPAYNSYLKQAKLDGLSAKEAEIEANDKISEDWNLVQKEDGSVKANAPIREDWYWAFEHYGDNPEDLTREDAPSPFAWSLLVGAWKNDTSWKSLQDKVAKDLFGGDVSDDDDRAFITTGMPTALRERFSGLLGEAKRLFSGKLPPVFGHTEGS